MKLGDAKYRHPYDVRLNAVRRYLTSEETAAEIAKGLGVTESTMRRYVRDLRSVVKRAAPSEPSPSGFTRP